MEATNAVWDGWGSVILVVSTTIAFMLIMAILVWQVFKTWQANMEHRATLARDRSFERLADKAVYTQQKLLEQQEKLLLEMNSVRDRVTGIEQKLAAVD